MKILLMIPLFFATSTALAGGGLNVKAEVEQIEAREKICLDGKDGLSTIGMKMCVGTAGEEFEILLNKLYRSIVAVLKQPSTELTREYNAEALKRLVHSQRDWVRFRDSDSDLAGISSFGGTMEGLEIGAANNEMTKARILQIHSLLAQ